MAEDVRVTNMPDSGSRFAVSLALTQIILAQQAMDAGSRKVAYSQDNVLKVYKACADTVGY